MTKGSSLPPLKKNSSKYGVIALLLVLVVGGLWFLLRTDESEPRAEVMEPIPKAPTREQFAPEIEILEEDAGFEDGSDDATPEPSQIRPAWNCRGILEASQIRQVISGQPRKQVQTCYERRLKDDNLLQGSMTVLLTIGPTGEVLDVSVDGSLGDRHVYSCVKRVAKTWRFPRPEGGCVQTAVPFQMMPKL